MNTGDTIVAISSAVGEAARMIVRLSGPGAPAVANNLTLRTGRLNDQASVERVSLSVNDFCFPAWVYTFVAPKSYTGEDLIELHLPGNPLLARMTLDACQQHGARLAEPGEFTARAYFNGRLDLAEAEGVAATIAAHGEAELAAARQLMAGELSRRLKPAMDLLADTLALVEVGIDFVDEDVTFLSAADIAERLDRADHFLASIQSDSSRFEKLSHEPQVVLVGAPNAGKSTLLNALAKQDRAVVSPIAGTTRDVLSAAVYLRRGSVQLIDIAGIEISTSGDVDRQMQVQALNAIETADVLIHVRDASSSETAIELSRAPDLTVYAKADLYPAMAQATAVSALTGEGLDNLRDQLDRIAFGSQTIGASLALTSRHLLAIDAARSAIARATQRSELEVLALEIRDALDHLGQILGVIAPDDLLGRIFSAFCIGK